MTHRGCDSAGGGLARQFFAAAKRAGGDIGDKTPWTGHVHGGLERPEPSPVSWQTAD